MLPFASLDAAEISAGNASVLYVSDAGDLYVWGSNSSGQLGDGTQVDRDLPVASAESGPWLQVATSLVPTSSGSDGGHSLAIKADGTLWTWGNNDYGQLGLGDTTTRLVPTQVGSATNWTQVEAGSAFSMALNADGEIWLWGNNNHDQLGNAVSAQVQTTPVRLQDKEGNSPNDDKWIAIAAGADYALAIHAWGNPNSGYGQIYAWGRNSLYQLGLGHTSAVSAPTRVGSGSTWKKVEAGSTSSFAIDSYFKLFAWGQGAFGGLGTGASSGTSIQNIATPTAVVSSLGNMTFQDVSAGTSHTLALSTNGFLFFAGQNASGQSGIANGQSLYNIFQSVRAEVSDIAAGRDYSAIELNDGSLLAAGSNSSGQLGLGGNDSSSSFVSSALGAVDLVVESVEILSDVSNVSGSSDLDIEIVVQNNGTGTIELADVQALQLDMALSPATNFGATGQVQFTEGLSFSVPAGQAQEIAGASTLTIALSVTLPASVDVGNYNLLVDLDSNDLIEEFDESNNTGFLADAANFTLDLLPSALSLQAPQPSYAVGDSITLDYTIRNEGTGDLDKDKNTPFQLKFLLTPDYDDLSSSTVLELSPTAGSSALALDVDLPAGNSYSDSLSFSIPAGVDAVAYYVVLVVDETDVLSEVDEANNISISGSKLISIAELSLAEGLDYNGTAFTTTGSGNWYGFAYAGAEDGDAAFSPSLGEAQSAALQTSLTLPSVIRFNWKSATSSGNNRLSFQATGGSEALEISGQTAWAEVVIPVASESDLRWEYYVGTANANDRVYVDHLRVDPMTAPDFVLDSLTLELNGQEVDSVSLVAGQGGLKYNLKIRNQGLPHPAGTPIELQIYLSRDSNFDPAEDVLVRSLTYSGGLSSNGTVTIPETINLPNNLIDDYYLIGVVDANNAVEEIGVNEAGLALFPDGAGAAVQYNNLLVSESAIVNVQALPDLTIQTYPSLDSISIIGNVFTAGLDTFAAEFTLKNEGLGGAYDSMQVAVFLSEDEVFDASDYSLALHTEAGGFSPGNSRSVQIFLPTIPSDIPVGAFRYVGVYIDSTNAFTETDETNNVVFTRNPVYAFGTVDVDDAAEYAISTPTVAPFSAGFPFFGQKLVTHDDVDALQSAQIGDSQKSYFEADIAVAEDSLLSFYWKVSSENNGTDKRDSLKLYSNGQLRTMIAGEVDWAYQTLLLPASGSPYTLRWSYEKDSSTSSGDDMGWVDQISVEALSEPDFSFSTVQLVIDGSEVDSAEYVLGRDQLHLNYDVRNGGVTQPAGGNIQVHFYLSEDEFLDVDDYPVDGGDGLVQTFTALLNSGSQFSNSPSITLDPTIPAGEYYLIATVDEPDNIVEFNETNNTFISESRIVKLLALPDLTVEYTNQAFGGLLLIDDSLEASMEITNLGYGVVQGDFDVRLFLSEDTVLDEFDLLLREYSQNENLTSPIGGDHTYTFTPTIGSVGEFVPLGQRLYLAAYVDADDVFDESNETNNTVFSSTAAFIFGQVDLAEALDWESTSGDLQNNEVQPFEGDLPFIGLIDESVVSGDIARSTFIANGESSGFVMNVDLDAPAAISFLWKVSSEFTENEDGTIKADTFTLYVDNVAYGDSIAGEVDWEEKIVQIPAGAHEIRWAYEKDDSLSAGSDSAWIDQLSFIPDLEISALSASSPAGQPLTDLRPKDLLDIELVVANTNLGDVPVDTAYQVEVRLSQDQVWGNDNDVILDLTPENALSSLPVVGAPTAGNSVTLNFNSLVPEETSQGNYYLLARVDPSDSNSVVNEAGLVTEFDDENNDFVSAVADVEIRALQIVEALDIDGTGGFDAEEFKAVFPAINLDRMVQTGDASWDTSPDIEVNEGLGRWFALAGVVGAVEGDAIKSPVLGAGSAASLLFRLDQPRVVSFRVKANTSSSRNYMFFGANGNALRPEGDEVSAYFSGASDLGVSDGWQQVHYIVPSGAPIGFTYVQELARVGDERVFVDQLVVGEPIDEPDYVIDSIQYTPGEYVLGSDRLYVIVKGSNRGIVEAPLPEDFRIKVWLSSDAEAGNGDDISLGYLEKFQDLDEDASFAYQASLILPEELAEGNYYIIARVDADDSVAEYAIDAITGVEVDEPAAFAGNDNNFLRSDNRDIFIDRRANLRVQPSEDSVNDEIKVAGPAADPDFEDAPNEVHDLFIIAPTEDEGPSELFVKFDILNRGLSGVSAASSDDFVINVYATTSREEELTADRLITSFVETRGLAAGSRQTYEITTDIPDYIQAGQFYYLSVVVDATDVISESDEEDNVTYSEHPNVFVGEVSLNVALDDEGNYTPWDYSFVVPTELSSTQQAPFYGTTSVYGQDNPTNGIRSSAQSGPVQNGGVSWMQTSVSVDSKRLISFRWRVSSQFEIQNGVIYEDVLQFSIRGVNDAEFTPIAQISGLVEWAQYNYTIEEPGDYILRWSYIENGDGVRAGLDAGWVDDFSAAAYDLIPTFVLPDADTYRSGDPINVPVYIWNIKDRQLPDVGVTTYVRLSTARGDVSNLDWTDGNASDVELTPSDEKFDKLDLDDLIWLRDNLDDLESSVSQDSLNALMDAGIRDLLESEANELEAELDAQELLELTAVLDAGSWQDYSDEQLKLVIGFDQSSKEQLSRKRFLPVRTYTNEPELTIPVGLSLSAEYYLGVWVNPLNLLLENNASNNLLWSGAKVVTLDADETVPSALERAGTGLLEDSADWELSGYGRWFPSADQSIVGGSSLSSPDVDQPIPVDGSAVVSARVEGPKLLRFQWYSEIGDAIDRVQFMLNEEPVMRESLMDPTPMELSSEDDGVWIEETILIPAGLQEIAWSYTRVDDEQPQGRVFVDNVRLDDIADVADLSIVDVSYVGGEYVLERDSFPLNVTVENRANMPVGFDYNDLDLEVRLSLDDTFESASELIGHIGVASVLDSGQRLVFTGDIELPINLTPGTYYLLVRVRSLDPNFQEFTYDTGVELLDNNDSVSVLQDVEITRLPQLVVRAINVENQKLFYPNETILFDWELENVGLGDIPAGTELTQTIELWQFDASEDEFLLSNAEFVMELDTVTEQVALPGRLTAQNAAQSLLSYRHVLELPGQAELLAALGADQVSGGMEDLDEAVIAALAELEDYQYFFVINRDQTIEQSSDLSVIGVTDQRFQLAAFPYDAGLDPSTDALATVDYASWQKFVSSRISNAPSGDLHADFGTSNFANLYYYAFNLPFLSDLSDTSPSLESVNGETTYNKARIVYDEGVAYPAITFPVVRGATDIIYQVQNSDDDGATWNTLLDIETPYLDTLYGLTTGYVGADTLTGEGGLVADPLVMDVVDHNYTANVTVRNDVAVAPGGVAVDPATQMRVVVRLKNQSDLSQFVIDYFLDRGVYDYTLMRDRDDYDGDGVSNFVELQLGTDPTDANDVSNPTFLEMFVAQGMGDAGVYGSPIPLNIGPLDDYDNDGDSNALELMSGSNPSNHGSTVVSQPVPYFVAVQLLNYNAFDVQPVDKYAPGDDYDGDGVSNIVELQLGRDPTDAADANSTTVLQNFVAERFVNVYSVYGAPAPLNIGPLEDYDGDGVSNLAEIQLGGNPISDLDTGEFSIMQAYTAVGMANAGVFGPEVQVSIQPNDNYDNDLINNGLEVMLGSDPTDANSGVLLTSLEYFVANRMFYSFIDRPVDNYGPFDDFDGDGVSNIAELMLSTSTSNAFFSPSDPLDIFVVEQFALLGEFGSFTTSYYASSDFDFDGVSNIAELQLGRNPLSNVDWGSTTELENCVAEQMAEYGAYGNPVPANLAPEDDYDGDGMSNASELQLGSDPTNSADVATTSASESALAGAFAAEGILVGQMYNGVTVVAADLASDADFDGDGESNLYEWALGGDMTSDAASSPSLQAQMIGTDFIVTYVRLIGAERPANLEIIAECALVLTGPWDAVPALGSTESLNADQTGLSSTDYERIDLTIDTNEIDCPFFRVSVSEAP
ncbi:CARDB domain-containing protein [Coraliomargarita sp. SDUM461003]|uniref:CARDB domain-containing protein n=1 Tax=Thalassobacterium maritimum TaxID=3041265 RepID=A0ABU1AZL6_9BACT|nr:CARDB domain-containing protein [Coraliomargarita sp. SDUM461003]MDQ8208704.1 CARDB domain-containing protein [Coraliomargarita sp. SDUM461003]